MEGTDAFLLSTVYLICKYSKKYQMDLNASQLSRVGSYAAHAVIASNEIIGPDIEADNDHRVDGIAAHPTLRKRQQEVET